jgi:quinol monooxygenase YgiN
MQSTVIIVSGDVEEIHRRWRDELLPVAAGRAADYGWTRSIVARSGDELVVVNLWEDADGLDRAFADEEIARIQDERLAPLSASAPQVRRLEVLEDLSF